MKQTKLNRWRLLPLSYKLSIYFIGFSAIMLCFLWIFQTMFLENCYTLIKQHQVSTYAAQITRSIKDETLTDSDSIGSISRQNEMSVYVYDSSNAILTKKYSSEFNNPLGLRDINMSNVYAYYQLAREQGNNYTSISKAEEREFDNFFDNFLQNGDLGFIPDDRDGFGFDNRQGGAENMIYAEIIEIDDDTECFVLITAMVNPVSSVKSTIQVQLLIVSIIFIVFAVVLAFLVSRRISRPLVEINSGVKELARQNYAVEFSSSGYLEVQELSNTLNVTRHELQKADSLRRELIANISHDLRTPLTMITGYGEVMRDLPGENTPENVQVIIDEANRLTNLVNDMLDLSKLQTGAIEIEREDFSLTDEIRDIFGRYAKLREQEGYDIQFIADKNAYVSADRVKIGQVIYNFVNNAITHCGDDKTVVVTQKTNDKRVRVEVTDHGDGIEPEKLRYIWDRYYKVDKEHKRGVIGTGLGLSIVKNILELHGAKYGVKSKPGAGSTFWFELECSFTEPLQ
ncbi:MAG: HAMP domain-containing histidine kinase [Ruminococcus sp.]|nr:HAMP domain-containing histidine kinase [Ruminococcus sp.]